MDWSTVIVTVVILSLSTYCESNNGSSTCDDDCKQKLTKFHEQNRFSQLICRDDSTLVVGIATEFGETHGIEKIGETYMVMINNRDASKLPSKTVYLTKRPMATIKHLHPRTTYNISADRLNENYQYTAKNYFMEFQTLDENYIPGSVTNIYTEEFSLSGDGNGVNVVILWDPSEDRTCSFNVLFHSRDLDSDNEKITVHEVRQPEELHRHELKQLAFGTEYAIGVEALNTKNENIKSEICWHTITTPECLELNRNNVSVCAPYHPENVTVTVKPMAENSRYIVNVSWDIAGSLPDNYTLKIIDYHSQSPQIFNISNGTTKSVQFTDVQIDGLDFEIFLTAHSNGGDSTTIHRGKIDPAVLYNGPTLQTIMLVIVSIFVAASMVILLVKLCLNNRAKFIRKQNRNKIFRELETKSPNDPTLYDNQFLSKEQLDQMCALQSDFDFSDDAMEMDPTQVKRLEVIGQGAFGCVWKAKLMPSEHIVAMKMLKSCPGYANVRNFYREIEVMKSVPKHPNIIGIVGHCTKNIFELMLFTEYCSGGSLLEFLRKIYDNELLQPEHDKIQNLESSKPKMYFTHELRDDSAFVSTSSSRISIVENQLYGLEPSVSRMCIVENHGYGFDIGNNRVENAITENDLLSFACQVANGMDFLAGKKLVHRDLACRNVLVLSDRTVKISDFGLSRDIYEESIYQKNGPGMLPIKWMAIESMTRNIYTTQSDVWSFGVLLYEIITKGGVPYPTMDSKDILKYLQDGKRLERPNGCRPDVYRLMRNCWNEEATDRPTFKGIKDELKLIMREMSANC